ncbi:hypothetical protein EV421DRAFT_1936921 [Armillaria borealis]|uniref:Uncharacterized protein n=1 Tax=Armillaria borealis TaxID=47425 RepID=A0AA39MDY3_9AGAR|nr:hypothetical protein EV421DRAFT_1936921 [Armillaria borealis]
MEELEPSLRRMSFGDSDTKHIYPEFYDAMRQHINNIGQHLRDSQFRLPTLLADFGQPSCDIAIAIVVIVALVTGFMGALKGPTYSELIKLTTVTTTIVAPLLYIRSTVQLVKRIMNARNALFQGVVMFIWSWKKFDAMQKRHTDGERVSVQERRLYSLLHRYVELPMGKFYSMHQTLMDFAEFAELLVTAIIFNFMSIDHGLLPNDLVAVDSVYS